MRNNSSGPNLLTTARTLLRDDLIPLIPSHGKYQALMVANAMAIAGRESELGAMEVFTEEFFHSLSQILEKNGSPDELIDILIKGIRQGGFSPDNQKMKKLHYLLVEDTKRRLRVSNPRYMTT